MAELRPFLSYFGSKWRAAKRYPPPRHRMIVEPFAGGAGYSLRYPDHDVVLVDKDPRIVAIWQFLIEAQPRDVLALPLLGLDQTIDDLPPCDPRGRELIRAWLQGASGNPKNQFSTYARQAYARSGPDGPVHYWSAACRARIAAQVPRIKHWIVIEGSYDELPNAPATWFVDPPYNNRAGETYRCGRKGIDYAHLGAWCREREGQVIVCENEGADWLPFAPLYRTTTTPKAGTQKRSIEVVWLGGAMYETDPAQNAIRLWAEMERKHAYNRTRTRRHGGKAL